MFRINVSKVITISLYDFRNGNIVLVLESGLSECMYNVFEALTWTSM